MEKAALPKFHGIYPMLYAFYGRGGELDRGAMCAQVNFCLDAKVHGIACLGLGTEVSKLSEDERVSVMQWAVEDAAGRVPVMVTIAGRTIAEAKAQISAAENAGAAWLVLQPPLGAQPDEPALMEFFAALMSATSLPTGIQNAPEYLGVGLSAENVSALADRHENFTVMKGEGPVCSIRGFIEGTNSRLAIFNGRGGLELPDNLRAGCAGMVPSADSADAQVAIYNTFRAGDRDEAYALYGNLLPLIVFIMQSLDHFLCYGKYLAAQRIGLATPPSSRETPMTPDAFGLESLARFSKMASIYANE
jgi:dihydrodipicolinate synthase/N-acetylneuraminate lyase